MKKKFLKVISKKDAFCLYIKFCLKFLIVQFMLDLRNSEVTSDQNLLFQKFLVVLVRCFTLQSILYPLVILENQRT